MNKQIITIDYQGINVNSGKRPYSPSTLNGKSKEISYSL